MSTHQSDRTMACRAVHFAIDAEDAARLRSGSMDDDKIVAFVEETEERWDEDRLQETDKAWDAIHRCLTNGQLEYGETPFHKCILGSHSVTDSDDFLVSVLSPEEVKEVAHAIRNVDIQWMKQRYQAIDAESYEAVKSEEDFGYTWGWFESLREFFQKAATQNLAMMFTVSQ